MLHFWKYLKTDEEWFAINKKENNQKLQESPKEENKY